MLIAVILDFATGKISNKLILTGFLLSFIFTIVVNKHSIIYYLLGTLIPILVLLFIFVIGGIGAGDVKLFAVIGGFIGYQGVLKCIITSFIVGAIIAVFKLLIQRNLIQTLHNISLFIFRISQSKQIQTIEREKSNTIHFTLPILFGVLYYIGGIL